MTVSVRMQRENCGCDAGIVVGSVPINSSVRGRLVAIAVGGRKGEETVEDRFGVGAPHLRQHPRSTVVVQGRFDEPSSEPLVRSGVGAGEGLRELFTGQSSVYRQEPGTRSAADDLADVGHPLDRPERGTPCNLEPRGRLSAPERLLGHLVL